jgi:tRNA-splicing ligase RtcB (3'-phosphate/5'-hydroxy nucleic acid ligase)
MGSLKIFAKTIEDTAKKQIDNLIESKIYEDSDIRIMPDVHAGAGCTIGTTMTIKDKITPNLIGVDIGCGMLTIKIDKTNIDLEKIDRIIKQNIPTGFNIHEKQQRYFSFDNLRCKDSVDIKRAKLSIGTLGGGNHFIEIGVLDKTDEHFLIIHSGSRNIGNQVCKFYQSKAEKLLLESDPKNKYKNLAYLMGQDFDDYLNDMEIMQHYASINRKMIAKIILNKANLKPLYKMETIHNYIDTSDMILRKGSISAKKEEKLLIPINMRDGSLIGIGKGNIDWNCSAPHGAGRLMSRAQAKKEITLKQFKESMTNIYSSSVSEKTLDEAPQAYKSIEEIKSLIGDTVEVIGVIKPIYNFKSE